MGGVLSFKYYYMNETQNPLLCPPPYMGRKALMIKTKKPSPGHSPFMMKAG